MARKSPLQRHHIRYGHEVASEHTVVLKMWMHRAVTLLARLNPTEEHYTLAMNFLHAVMQVCNDHRSALDNGEPKHASQIRPKD
jgi:hypothetical protein